MSTNCDELEFCNLLIDDEFVHELPMHPGDTLEACIALFYLRWLDYFETKQDSIRAPHHEPVLSAALQWSNWRQFPEDRLREFFSGQLLPKLRKLGSHPRDSQLPLLAKLTHFVQELENLNEAAPESLKELNDWLAEQPFETEADHRAVSEALDQFLYLGSDHIGNAHFTNEKVARLMVDIAAPASGESVHDPCFGFGGLLTLARQYARDRDPNRSSQRIDPELSLSGVEITEFGFLVGQVRLAITGVAAPDLEKGDSLVNRANQDAAFEGADVILANPPWGERAESEGLDHFPVQTNDTTGLFVQRILQRLRPGGRAVVLVPQSFLSSGGANQKVRQMLLEQHTVDAVVALPENALMPVTSMKASILVFRRGGKTKRVRMLDGAAFYNRISSRRTYSILPPGAAEQMTVELRAPEAGDHSWDVKADLLANSDWDLTPKRRDYSGLEATLEALQSAITISRIEKTCEVLGGRSIKSAQLVDKPDSEEAIPYIRIRDIQRGQAGRGSSFLGSEAIADLNPKWKLEPGDVLLSKSGTIGKVGIVSNRAVGAIAASGFYVVRPDRGCLDSDYLSAFLDSVECRTWLNERARGATVQHLTKSNLVKLPIPLPSIEIQREAAAQQKEHGVDVLAFLKESLLNAKSDPIAEWIERASHTLASESAKNRGDNNIGSLLNLSVIGEDLKRVRNKITLHGRDRTPNSNPLSGWLIDLADVADLFEGAFEIPKGPALFSTYQRAEQLLIDTERQISGHARSAERARELTKALGERFRKAKEELLREGGIVLSCQESSFPPGAPVEFDLIVTNNGPLPLRNLSFESAWGRSQIGYFPEAETHIIPMSGRTPDTEQEFGLLVTGKARDMNGSYTELSFSFAIKIADSPTPAAETVDEDLGASPYVCGDPVRPDRRDVFFGREELLEQIRRQITQSGNVVLLEGNRRAGKTSVLWHLEGADAVHGWVGVYCSFQGAEGSSKGVGVPTVEIFRSMATSIAKKIQSLGLELPLPDGSTLPPGKKLGIVRACREGIRDDSSFSDFREYLESALDVLESQAKGLLLMLDEFDKLQEGIDSGVTSPQVPENIRFCVQSYPRFSAILTGSRRLKRMREEYWSALFGLGTRFGVTSLPEEPARRLITSPVEDRLDYSREAVNRVILLTARQPYLMQCLCNRIFDMAAQAKSRSVTVDLVERAGRALVEDNEHFASLWGYAETERRRFLLALCHRESEGPDPLRLGVIQERLSENGIEVSDEDLIVDLEFLQELELIDKISGSIGDHYALTIPLMGVWIEKQQDFAATRAKAQAETEDQNE